MPDILIVEDEDKLRTILKIILMEKNYNVFEAENGVIALSLLRREKIDIVISDIKMPEMNGIELFEKIKEENIPVPVIFITAFATIESAVEAIRAGVFDYIQKPFEEDKIILTVERALGLSKILKEKDELRSELQKIQLSDEIIFESDKMRLILIDTEKAVRLNSSVYLITGESGVGKELIAKYIHKVSDRRNKRFVALNCNAIPKELVESELFGYEKGAFTGAIKDKKGAFEIANGGTIFLDEIGDIPIEVQGKLLRVLQEKKFIPIGSSKEIAVDLKIVAATNKNLKKMVDNGEFRDDLYYRLNVIPIEVPPLRDRREDIIPLAENFIKRNFGSFKEYFTETAIVTLKNYNYPGNVRELRNIVERAYILSNGVLPLNVDSFAFLKDQGGGSVSSLSNFELSENGINLEDFEKSIIKQALDKTGGNKSAAARLLGLTRTKFRTRVKMLEED